MRILSGTSAIISLSFCLLSACSTDTYQVTFPLPNSSSSSQSSSIGTADSTDNLQPITGNSSAESETSPPPSSSSLPSSVKIDVPFQSQAPLSNWDAVHEEACEEASLILVQRYLTGQTTSPQQMENEIQKLVSWETQHGYAQDVTVAQLKDIAHGVYGLHGTVLTDTSVDSIKRQIASGNPVIIPAAGQMLGNPYFSGQGPPYHMLVIIGYNDTSFITDDVGTRRGANYAYSFATIENAIHDWTGSNATIQSGKKDVLVLKK
ncbi:MAG TPA: C39 family peptidase [Candidatus Peribacteraceae bacterium]|nr:C39 family peptidase [Candidatus Peribacteraceae bacterium]